MIMNPSAGIVDKVRQLALDADSFAYLLVSDDGVLLDQGGDLLTIDIPQWERGDNILDSALFLLGYLPMTGEYECIVNYQLGDDCVIDVHLFNDDDSVLVVLVDRTVKMMEEKNIRQQANELKLRRRRERKSRGE